MRRSLSKIVEMGEHWPIPFVRDFKVPITGGGGGAPQTITFTNGFGVADSASRVFTVAVDGSMVWGNQYATYSNAATGVVQLAFDDASFDKTLCATTLSNAGYTVGTRPNNPSTVLMNVLRQRANDSTSNLNINYVANYRPKEVLIGSSTGFNIVTGINYIRFRNGEDDIFVIQDVVSSTAALTYPYQFQAGGTIYNSGNANYNTSFSATASIYRSASTTANTNYNRYSVNNTTAPNPISSTTYWFSNTAYDGDQIKVGMAGTGHWVEFYTGGVLKHMIQGTYNPVGVHPVIATFAKTFPNANGRYIATSTADNNSGLAYANNTINTVTTTTAQVYQHLRLINTATHTQVIGVWTA